MKTAFIGISSHILGTIPLAELTANDLQQFYAQMKKGGRLNRTQIYGGGLSGRMVRTCHTRCLTALDRAVVDGLIHVNPTAGCKLPGQALKDMNLLTREEMQRFLIQAKEDSPLDPATVRKRLQTILKHVGCRKVRFHDLRHPNVKPETKIFLALPAFVSH